MAPGAVAPGPKNDESSARGLCKAYVRESLPLPYCISNYCWLYLQKLACDRHLQPTAQTKHKAVKYSFQTLTSTWVPWKNQSKHTNTWTNMLIGWTNFPSSLIRCCYLFGLLSLSLLFRLLLSLFCHCGCHCHRRCVCGSGRSCSRSSSRSSFSLVPCIFLLICTATKGWFLARHQSWGLPRLAPGHFSSIVSRPRTFQTNALLFLVSIWRQLRWQSVFSVFKGYISRTPARLAKYFTTNLSKVHAVSCSIFGGGVRLSARSHHARINAPATSSTSPPTAEHVSMTKSVLRWVEMVLVPTRIQLQKPLLNITDLYWSVLSVQSWLKILAEAIRIQTRVHYMFLGFCLEKQIGGCKVWMVDFAGIFTPFALDRTEVRCFQPCERQTLSWLKVHRAPKSVISKPDLLYLAGPRSAEGDAAGFYCVCVCVCVWHMNREYIYIYGM